MIYKNSRYTNTGVEVKDGHSSFKIRNRISFSEDNAIVHQFTLGDRLDGLAMTYYNDPQLWWVILEANPQYRCEIDIPYGSNLVIPNVNEVRKCLMY